MRHLLVIAVAIAWHERVGGNGHGEKACAWKGHNGRGTRCLWQTGDDFDRWCELTTYHSTAIDDDDD